MSATGHKSAPDRGDVIEYRGLVRETSNEGIISVDCMAYSDELIEYVVPDTVTPLLWCPNPGQEVWLVERFDSEAGHSLRWRGWTEEQQAAFGVQQEGSTALISPSGELLIMLDDGVGDDRDDPTDDEATRLLVGRSTSSEGLVCGALYKAWMEATLDSLEKVRAASEAGLEEVRKMITIFIPILVAADIAHLAGANAAALASMILFSAPPGSFPGGSVFDLATFIGRLTTEKTTMATQKADIADHVSTLVFTSKS